MRISEWRSDVCSSVLADAIGRFCRSHARVHRKARARVQGALNATMKTVRFKPQRLPPWRRAVIKVGSSLVAGDDGLSTRHASAIGLTVARLIASGHAVLLVSSGAVAAGRAILGAAMLGSGIAFRSEGRGEGKGWL